MTSMRFTGGKIDGTITPPPSKSHTHRAFLLASMAKGRSVIGGPLMSNDTRATLAACRAMGAEWKADDGRVIIDGGDLHAPESMIDADNSGTTMRLYAGICSMFDREVGITGDASLRKRPMGPLLDALSSMGVQCRSDNGFPPVYIKGPNRGGKVSIDGHISSQYISSLLLASPMLPEDTEITVEGTMVSVPYLDVTARMMSLFGAEARRDGNVFTVKGGTGYRPYDYRVPSDFSSAAFPLVAGALGGITTADNMDLNDPQGDKAIIDIIRKAGGKVEVDGDRITASKGELRGCDVDLGNVPDLFPIVAVLLASAEGESRLYGAPQLRFKESDRIKTVTDMINAIGGDATPTDDGCTIRGRRLKGGRIVHLGDHRIMMAAAVASIACEGPVEMDDAECCAVSFPSFPEDMRRIGLGSEEIRCTRSAAD